MQWRIRPAVLLLALVAASCSGAKLPVQPSSSPSTTPSAASTAPSPPPPTSNLEPITSFAVSGSVRDTHLNGLADAAVEIVDGPMSGTVVRTGPQGQFKFPDAFTEEATLRATQAGYLTATARVLRPTIRTVGGPQTLVTLELPSPEPSPDISGNYTFTVINSPACDVIPEELRVRNYDVTVAPYTNPYSFRMNFSDPNVVDAWGPTVEIRLKGSQMQMVIGDWRSGIIEDLPSGWLTFFGYATATITNSGVSGLLLQGGSGSMYCPGARPYKGTNRTSWECAASEYCSKGISYSLTRR
jgi:hypothetical protein